ncbi:MAG TPA: hypothetical protein VFD91_09195 [Mariniphaga sp.]|nr:hypothetical protein [Mariniphaga sp.]
MGKSSPENFLEDTSGEFLSEVQTFRIATCPYSKLSDVYIYEFVMVRFCDECLTQSIFIGELAIIGVHPV